MKRGIINYHSWKYWLNDVFFFFAFVDSKYRKLTFTGLYLSWGAFASKSKKVNLIKCLIVRTTRLKVILNRLKIYFWVTGILWKLLLSPLTKLSISLGITSGHLALLNAQFMLDFPALASWLLIRFLSCFAVKMRLGFEPSLQLDYILLYT